MLQQFEDMELDSTMELPCNPLTADNILDLAGDDFLAEVFAPLQDSDESSSLPMYDFSDETTNSEISIDGFDWFPGVEYLDLDLSSKSSDNIKIVSPSAPAKRPRGRPPIVDPVLKAKNKKKTQLKASQNYRQKKKSEYETAEEIKDLLSDRNKDLKANLIALRIESNDLIEHLNQCKAQLNSDDLRKFNRSVKKFNSIYSSCSDKLLKKTN